MIIAPTRVYSQAVATRLLVGGDVSAVATTRSVDDAMREASEFRPDVILIDSSPTDGRRLVRGLHRIGLAETQVLPVAVVANAEEICGWAAVEGVCGCLTQEIDLEELVSAVFGLGDGDIRCSSSVARLLFRYVGGPSRGQDLIDCAGVLTRRQLEIVGLLAEGLSNKEIASALCVELPTVKNHVHQIFERLGIHSRAEAGKWFRVLAGSRRSAGSLY